MFRSVKVSNEKEKHQDEGEVSKVQQWTYFFKNTDENAYKEWILIERLKLIT